MAAELPPRNIIESFARSVANTLSAPATWVRENIVEPNRPEYYWYHRKFQRVPTVDQCYVDDAVCITEATEQLRLDKLVDAQIVAILRERQDDCILYEGPNHMEACAQIREDYETAADNFFIKYGDLGPILDSRAVLMKQKHRMIWERRHGKVGTGMKEFK